MVLNFPTLNLQVGDTYNGPNGVLYTYDGSKWVGSTNVTSTIVNGNNVVQVDQSGDLVVPNGAMIIDQDGNPIQGFQGATGPTGLRGHDGSTGVQGPIGATGPTGAQGVSVVLQGTKELIADLPLTGSAGHAWIVTESNGGDLFFWNLTDGTWDNIGKIVGPQGDPGPQGEVGASGIDGATGYTGATGLRGYTGADGATGPQGDIGATGVQGATGPQGPGADQDLNTYNDVTFHTVNFPLSGVDIPSTAGQSAGTKIVLWPESFVEGHADYAIGISDYSIWNSVPLSGDEYSTYYFKWYAGDTKILELDGYGNLTAQGDITSEGTVSANGLTVNNDGKLYFGNLSTEISEQRPGDDYVFSATPTTAVTGGGSGCLLNVRYAAGATEYQVSVNDGGAYSYAVGDLLKITGDQLGGVTPDNDLVVEVTQLYFDTPAPFAVFDVGVVTGTPPAYEDGLHIRTGGVTWTFAQDNKFIIPGGIKFADGTIQTTAALGGGGNITISEIDGSSTITNEVTNVTALRFDKDTGFNVTDLGGGEVKVSLGSSWKTWQVDGQDSLVAVGEDTVTFVAGSNMTISTDANAKTITFASAGGAGTTDRLVNGDSSVTLSSQGILGFTNSGYIAPDYGNIVVAAGGDIVIRSNAETNTNDKEWTFGEDGNLTTPGNIDAGGNLTVDLNHYLGFAAEDVNWGMGYKHGSYAKVTVSNSIDIQVGKGDWTEIGEGYDGFTIGQCEGGVSIMELNGYNGNAWFRNNITLGSNLILSAGGIVKDSQTLKLTDTSQTEEEWNALILGVENSGADILVGTATKGLSVQANGYVILQGQVDGEAGVVITGGYGIGPNTNGGSVFITGGASNDGAEGNVDIHGNETALRAIETVLVIGNEVDLVAGDSAWTLDPLGGLTFPDNTTQYTAYQGTVVISDTAPEEDFGRVWFNSIDGRLYIKYNDNWVDANPTIIPSPETYLDQLSIDGTTISAQDGTVNVEGNLNFTGSLLQNGVPFQAGASTGDIIFTGTTITSTGTNLQTLINNNVNADYTAMYQDGHQWEAYAENDTDGPNPAWAWINANLNDGPNHPRVFIEIVRATSPEAHRWTFDAEGTLRLAGNIIATEGRYYQDCAGDGGFSSMRWINADQTGEKVELGRVYSDGGTPYNELYFESNERVQWGYREVDPGVSSFYITTTQNVDGIDVNNTDDKQWTFLGTGGLQFPDGTTQDTAAFNIPAVITSETAPAEGPLWFNSTDGRLYVNYNDNWVDANPTTIPAPETYLDGLTIDGTTIGVADSANKIVVGADLVPETDLAYNLGSPTKQWNALYVSSSTIYLDNKALSLTSEGLTIDGGPVTTVIDGGEAATWLLPV